MTAEGVARHARLNDPFPVEDLMRRNGNYRGFSEYFNTHDQFGEMFGDLR